MTTLTLVRHGETDWNLRRLIQGSTDIPLNDTGRRQAQEAGALLRTRLGPRSDDGSPVVVVSSDLSRARETAQIIAAELEADAPRSYPQLRERNYGDAEGVDIAAFRERWGDWDHAVVPNAEAWADVRVRALSGLRAAIRDARRTTFPVAPSVVVVSHGALIREVIRHATGGEFPSPGERLANGSAHTFLMERDRLSLLDYAGVAV